MTLLRSARARKALALGLFLSTLTSTSLATAALLVQAPWPLAALCGLSFVCALWPFILLRRAATGGVA